MPQKRHVPRRGKAKVRLAVPCTHMSTYRTDLRNGGGSQPAGRPVQRAPAWCDLDAPRRADAAAVLSNPTNDIDTVSRMLKVPLIILYIRYTVTSD